MRMSFHIKTATLSLSLLLAASLEQSVLVNQAHAKGDSKPSGIGIYLSQSAATSEVGSSGKAQLRFDSGYGIEFTHNLPLSIGPLMTIHTSLDATLRNGTAEYYQIQEAPLTSAIGSDVRFSSARFAFSVGPQFRPLPYSPIGPLLGVGWGLGALRLAYDDPDMQAKVGSSNYANINVGFFYTMYVEAGLELRLLPVGVDVAYRKKYFRGVNFDTLPNKVSSYYDDEIVAHVIFGF